MERSVGGGMGVGGGEGVLVMVAGVATSGRAGLNAGGSGRSGGWSLPIPNGPPSIAGNAGSSSSKALCLASLGNSHRTCRNLVIDLL